MKGQHEALLVLAASSFKPQAVDMAAWHLYIQSIRGPEALREAFTKPLELRHPTFRIGLGTDCGSSWHFRQHRRIAPLNRLPRYLTATNWLASASSFLQFPRCGLLERPGRKLAVNRQMQAVPQRSMLREMYIHR